MASNGGDLPLASVSTVRAGAVFTATGVLQRAVNVLLLPLFVAHVPIDDYGRLAVAWSVAGLLAPIAALGLEAAAFRGIFTTPPEQRNAFVVTLSLAVAAASGVTAVALGAVVAGVGAGVGVSVPPDIYGIALAAAAVYVAATAIPLAVFRAERRLASFVAVNIAYVVVYVLLMLGLVVAGDGGAVGWLLAQLFASVAAAVTSFALLWGRRARPVVAFLAGALALGLPLVPHAVSHWALALSDRLLLGIWVSAAELGRYNVAYQLAAGLGLVYVAVNHAVMADYGRRLAGTLDPARLTSITRRQIAFVLITGIAGISLGVIAVEAILPSSYDGASTFLPWLVLAHMLFGLYLIPMNTITVILGDTSGIWRPTVAAAAANLGLNLALIPLLGAVAAALATVVTYGLLLVLVTRRALRSGAAINPRSVVRIGVALLVAVAASGLALLTLPDDGLLAVAVASAWVGVGSAVVLFVLRLCEPLFLPGVSRA